MSMNAPSYQAVMTQAGPRRSAARAAPASVARALSQPGQTLAPHERRRMEARFQHDFGRVQLHTDAAAAASARDVAARAYTVGQHIVFGAGAYQPATSPGEELLRHELAHVVQQASASEHAIAGGVTIGRRDAPAEAEADRVVRGAVARPVLRDTEPTVRRRWFGEEIAGLFAGEDFPDAELQAYLAEIDKTGKIQDYTDSDNKARAVVRAWRAGKPWAVLTTKLKSLLVQEMLSGYLSDEDQTQILELLENCEAADLSVIFAPGTVDPVRMEKRFDGEKRQRLDAFFDARFVGGWAAVQKGSITPKPDRLTAPFSPTQVGPLLESLADQLENAVATVPDNVRVSEVARRVETFGARLLGDWRGLPPAQRDAVLTALQDEQVKRAVTEANAKRDYEEAKEAAKADPAHPDAHKSHVREVQRKAQRAGMIAHILQTVLEGWYQGVAVAAPTEKALEATTQTLTATQAAAAREALRPDVAGPPPGTAPSPPAPGPGGEAPAPPEPGLSGTAPSPPAPGPGDKAPAPPAAPPVPKFIDKIPGEAETYTDKVTKRGPDMVQERWKRFGEPRSEARHADTKQTHKLTEIATISNASAHEVDLVFGSYKKGDPIEADEFDTKGVISKGGQIHDAWASEQSKSEQSKDSQGNRPYQKQSATFWVFYLFQNDEKMKAYNYKHNAQPEFDKEQKPHNDEAKIIEKGSRS